MLRRSHLALALVLGAGATGVGVAAAASPTPAPSPASPSVPASPSSPSAPSSPSSSASPSGTAGASASATIKDAKGNSVGLVRIDTRDNGKSRVKVVVRGLPPGYHGFHIHNKGLCDPKSTDPATGSPFFSAGTHFDLGSNSHPDHSGDLPSLLVGKDGIGRATVVTDRFQVRQLLDGDGSSIVVHSRPDNQANIPKRYGLKNGQTGPDAETLKTGDSGIRIACGVITGS
ncbi:superoxide dismutase family protein [Streptosporangium canum]|uniref:superoxide dismutase family protein n=1 Tax=Streptosporangium canum TaxID=324952 RepID=UPI0034265E4C